MTNTAIFEPARTMKEHLMEWLVVPIIGGFSIGIFFALNDLKAGDYGNFLEASIISTIFWIVLGNGNSVIIHFIDKRWTWLEAPIRRTIIGLIAMLGFTAVASLVVLYIYVEFYFGVNFIDVVRSQGIMSMLMTPLIITIVVSFWLHGQSFFISWRQAAIDVERLKTENMESRFESLRNQVNPHFLFNSLNALSSLVYVDQDRAVDFIQKLSEVYRYVLDHQNDEVVPLEDELRFLKSFVYLNKIRFGANFKVEYKNLIDIDQWSVPPVALQMLLENCIKHNEVSNDRPLQISISMEDNTIQVINNRNPVENLASSGLGLDNIRSRYEILSDEKVKIEESESDFKVVLPLLKLE